MAVVKLPDTDTNLNMYFKVNDLHYGYVIFHFGNVITSRNSYSIMYKKHETKSCVVTNRFVQSCS